MVSFTIFTASVSKKLDTTLYLTNTCDQLISYYGRDRRRKIKKLYMYSSTANGTKCPGFQQKHSFHLYSPSFRTKLVITFIYMQKQSGSSSACFKY